jgi:hypothetical protein
MDSSEKENPWDRSLRGVNGMMEGIARRIPLYRSLHRAFQPGADLLDWSQAGEIAVLVAQSEAADVPPPSPDVQAHFEEMMERSEELVREYSRLENREPVGPLLVFDRPAWIDTNLGSFKLIFEPLAESYEKATAFSPRSSGWS